MSRDCNLARVAWHSARHTHTHSFIHQGVSVILAPPVCSACLPVFHDHFILSAPSPTSPHLLLSVLSSTCSNTLSPVFPLASPLSTQHIWHPISLSSALLSLLPTLSHHCRPLTIHFLIICQDAAFSKPLSYVPLMSSSPLWASLPSFFTFPFLASAGVCELIPCFFSLSYFALKILRNVYKTASSLQVVLVGSGSIR